MQIHKVEQRTAEWFALRAGTPTASEFSKLVTGTGKASTQVKGYAARLAAEKFAGGELEKWEGSQWTVRGAEMEPEARAAYELLGADVEEVGFVTNHGAGCSPDGLVGDEGLCEIKCLSPEKHVLALAYHAKHGRAPVDYIPQVQGQIWLCQRKWCDLYFYHPKLPELCIRVESDSDYQSTLAEQVEAVLSERDRLVQILEAA